MSGCLPIARVSAMTVRWVDGSERLTLFNYDPTTHGFTEVETGISAGRASIANAPDLAVKIEGGNVLAASGGGTLQAHGFSEFGGVASTKTPRLEFFIGETRVGTVSAADGFKAHYLTEQASIPSAGAGELRFEFYVGGVKSATLERKGLVTLVGIIEEV